MDVCNARMLVNVQTAYTDFASHTTSCLLIPLLAIPFSILYFCVFFLVARSPDTIFFVPFAIVFDHVPFSVDDLHHYCPISNYTVIACSIGYINVRRKSCHVIPYFMEVTCVWACVCGLVCV